MQSLITFFFERGSFGVPTFFVNDQIFFGKDKLVEIEEYLSTLK